jgi:hypothetical protein
MKITNTTNQKNDGKKQLLAIGFKGENIGML